ncbi:MAG: hypothetical protein HY589_02815 [Candidatus Omnitrophica bacterium]|nr:hypothetical protein [Candidatus Omnitrophota bacterium]
MADKKIMETLKREKLFFCALALNLIIMIFAVANFSGLKERHKRAMAAREGEISRLAEKMAVISDARTRLQAALGRSIRKKAALGLSLEAERKRKEELDRQLLIALAQISASADRIKDLEREKNDFKKMTGELEKEKQALNEKVNLYSRTQAYLQGKIKRLLAKAKVELNEVVITPESSSGKILKANRDYNFVIVDLGRNDGVKAGERFIIYRDDKETGEAVIEKVYDELSVGKAAFAWTGDEVRVGDVVKGKQ